MRQNMGASPLATGLAGADAPEPCGLGPSDGIPSAVTIPGELYAFLMGEGPLEGVWFGDMHRGFRGTFWWRALLRCAAGWPTTVPTFRLRRVVNGTMTRGWQVLRDEKPISGLFDKHGDAVAALKEFRTDEAIAMEAQQGGNAEERSHAEHDSAGLEEASPNTGSQTPAPKE